MPDVHCAYCEQPIEGGSVVDEDKGTLIVYAHRSCYDRSRASVEIEPHDQRTCPGCNGALTRPYFAKLYMEGYVCEGCKLYYSEDMEAVARLF